MALRVFQFQAQVAYEASSATDFTRSLSDALSLGNTASYSLVTGDVGHSLTLSETVTETLLIGDREVPESVLNLVQTAVAEGFRGAEHELDLTQSTAVIGPKSRSYEQPANIRDEASYTFSGVPWTGYDVWHGIHFKSRAGQPETASASTALGLGSEASPWIAEHDLNLTETVSGGKGYEVEDDLDLTQAVERDAILNPDESDDLGIKQAAAWYIESRCNRLQRTAFHGTGGVAPSDPPLKYDSQFTIFSKEDYSDYVQLRNPATDNRRRHAFQRVNRTLFDGTVDVYVDDGWATELDQLYTITATKESDLNDLTTFLLAHLGEEVIIKDWEGVSWNSIVLNVNEALVEDSEGYWTIELTVRSERVDGEYVPHNVDLSLSATGTVDRPKSPTESLSVSGAASYVTDYAESESDPLSLTSGATYVLSP